MEEELRGLVRDITKMSNYIRIHEENVAARMASNDVAEIFVLLSEMRENANIILSGVDEENEGIRKIIK
ncbi:hypothetical protein C1645_816834 [Glomus cerebriforme]|uniref:Uncharacterized protein n=1 Tax=Glomus cerebriforme TaxID=658196 RepID=A0A397TG29_9GLOM|nr:hypothetical protein C1645_816834 [Glomus cerebriforme]